MAAYRTACCNCSLTDFVELIPLFKGLDVPSKIDKDKTFSGAREQFWPDALPAATND